jgi:hypothetical protein
VFTAGAWARCFIGYAPTARRRSSRKGEPLALGIAADLDQTWLSLGAVGGNDGKHHLGSVMRMRADAEAARSSPRSSGCRSSVRRPGRDRQEGAGVVPDPGLEEAGVS